MHVATSILHGKERAGGQNQICVLNSVQGTAGMFSGEFSSQLFTLNIQFSIVGTTCRLRNTKAEGVSRNTVPSSELGELNVTAPKTGSLQHTEIVIKL